MEQLTMILFERMGILLIIMFILTRIPLFRYLLDRRLDIRSGIAFSLLFGVLGIAGTYAGVVVSPDEVSSEFWVRSLGENEVMAHSALIGVVIAGLLGGAYVGAGAGLITGLHALMLGGLAGIAYGISTPIIGLLAGMVARFFYEERVIAPVKAMFIGVFAPVLQMGVLLVCTTSSPIAIEQVNRVGIPMVTASGVGIAIFVALIRVALAEEERTAALETQRAFNIAEMVLPHLKMGLNYSTAEATASILIRELSADAVAVTDKERILSHKGIGTSRHVPGEAIITDLSREAIRTGRIQVVTQREQIQPHHPALGAAIIVPFTQSGQTAGLIKLYFRSPKQIRKVEEEFAQGLSKLISSLLTSALAEKLEALMKEAELRALQAQIHPHFLFNTLNSIVTLIRIDPDSARKVTVQLGQFMRMSLTMTQSALVPLYQEKEHVAAYLDIIRVRHGDRLQVEMDLNAQWDGVMIPPSTLQPLIENSIQHGLRNKGQGGWIRIYGRPVSVRDLQLESLAEAASSSPWSTDFLEIRIEDNGGGIQESLLGRLGTEPLSGSGSTGLGVYNVNQRLINLLGADAGLKIANRPEGGSRVGFIIPCRHGEQRGKEHGWNTVAAARDDR